MAWLTGWTRRKEITVTNTNADYQVKVLVGQSSGASGEDVDCGGNVADDFDDLRFTEDDGTTLLDYWIESLSGANPNILATVWVQINAGADTTLYMYYDGTETAVSSGSNTFIVFDDFERGNNGDPIGGDWTIGTGDIDISTEQAFGGTRSGKWIGVAGDPPVATIPHTAADTSYAIMDRIYKEEDANLIPITHGNGTKRLLVNTFTDEKIRYYDGEYKDTGSTCVADTWFLIEVRNINFTAGTFDIYYNDGLIKEAATMHTASSQQDVIRVYGTETAGNDSWIDNVIVRKWTATEPSFAFGAEEGLPATISAALMTIGNLTVNAATSVYGKVVQKTLVLLASKYKNLVLTPQKQRGLILEARKYKYLIVGVKDG